MDCLLNFNRFVQEVYLNLATKSGQKIDNFSRASLILSVHLILKIYDIPTNAMKLLMDSNNQDVIDEAGLSFDDIISKYREILHDIKTINEVSSLINFFLMKIKEGKKVNICYDQVLNEIFINYEEDKIIRDILLLESFLKVSNLNNDEYYLVIKKMLSKVKYGGSLRNVSK